MTFCTSLNQTLENWHLLKHPFYQAWNEGTLSKETLQTYAKEYYHHVAAFPRYISQIYALCENKEARVVLLENLIEEARGENNHPELWMRFADGLGVSRDEIKDYSQSDCLKNTQALVDGFYDLVKSDYATGLGALYAYERQTPAVSRSKIDGLIKHYGITDDRTLEFFSVHEKADEWHTEEVTKLMEALSPEDKQKATKGAELGAQLLWQFLDGMTECQMH